MELSVNDLQELRRMSSNLYGEDKNVINRVIQGINLLLNVNRKLNDEIKQLKAGAR